MITPNTFGPVVFHEPDPIITGDSPAAEAQRLMDSHAAALVTVDPQPPVQRLDAGFNWPDTRDAVRDIAERALWNGAQAAAPLVLGMVGIGGLTVDITSGQAWLLVLTLFASSAIVSIAKNLVAWGADVSPKPFGIDTAIGVGTAFLGALAGYVIAAPSFDVAHFAWVDALRLSAGAALLSLTKMSVWPAVKQAIAKKNLQAQTAGPSARKTARAARNAPAPAVVDEAPVVADLPAATLGGAVAEDDEPGQHRK